MKILLWILVVWVAFGAIARLESLIYGEYPRRISRTKLSDQLRLILELALLTALLAMRSHFR